MAKVIRKELVVALEKVAPGIGSKENDIQATCLLFSEGFVYTYNDEVSVSALLPEALSEVECAVQAKDFISLLSKMSDEEIDIELTDNHLLVKGKRVKAQIVIENEIKMPIDEIEMPEKWRALPDDFILALKSCIPIVGKDMSKPLSTCIHLADDRVETSDVDRACKYTLDKVHFKKPIYLPGTSARIVVRFNVKKYNTTQGWIHFKCEDDTILSCRTYYDGQEFADLTHLLEAEGTELELPVQLSDALERSGIFVMSTDNTEVVMEDKYVCLSIADNWCKVKGEGSLGRYEEKIRINYEGNPISFSTKVETLKDALEKHRQCEVCSNFIKIYDEKFTHLVAVLTNPEYSETKVRKRNTDDEVPF